MPYSVPDLAYPFDALEPHIDARTMEIHHDKHHAAYVTNLNAALEGTEWIDRPIEAVITNLEILPEDKRAAVRNNGGGHANHTLFWEIMGPNGGGEPTGDLASAIDATFGSLDEPQDAGQRRRCEALRLRLELARLGRDGPRGPLDPEPGLADRWRARRRSSGSTSGSTRTTSTTRTGAPTTSRPGGTSSTGTPSPRSSRRRGRARRAGGGGGDVARAAPPRVPRRPRPNPAGSRPPYSRCGCGGHHRPPRARTSTGLETGGGERGLPLGCRAPPAGRHGRPVRVRGDPSTLRAVGARDRAAPDRRPRARRGRPQDTFASVWRSRGGRPGAGRRRVVALHGRAERDRRRPPPTPPPTVDDPPEVVSSDPGAGGRGGGRVDVVAGAPGARDAPRAGALARRARVLERALQSEIADYVNLPLGTVKTRTRSALRRLADELEGELR